jgi:hypothetical protein
LAFNLAAIYAFEWTGRTSLRRGFLLNLATLALLAGVLPRRKARGVPFGRRRSLAALAAIVILGVAMRTAYFGSYPPADGQLWEETQTGKVAYDSIRGGSLDPYFPLTNLIGEAGLRLFGRSLTSLRLGFVAVSVVSIPLFFLAARWLLRSMLAALLATALFAAAAFPAGAGRLALETMAPLFTLCLALLWTFRAAAERSYGAFAFAGLASGLLLTEYFGYKLVPLLSAGFLALAVLRPPSGACCNTPALPYDAARLGPGAARLLVFAAFALAVVVPLFLADPRGGAEYFLEGYQRQQVGIAGETAGLGQVERWAEALSRVGQMASFVFWRGNDNDVLPATMGIVDPATGWIGLAALLHCAWWAARSPAKAYLVAAVVAITVLSGALVGNPARYRLAVLVPFYLLAIGVAADDLLARRGRGRPLAAGLSIAVVAALVAANVALFFGRVVVDRDVRLEFYDLNLLLARAIATAQAGGASGPVFLISDRDFLGQGNDYEFLYDRERVRVVPSAAEVKGPGSLIAHDGFIEEIRRVRNTSGCRREEPWFGENRIVSCRVGEAVRE